MRTYAYIDGFNFYYGAMKNSPYKWLDFRALFTGILVPGYDLLAIKYFTAYVSAMPHDPEQPHRQRIFIKALKKYIPELTVILGQFRAHNARLPLAHPSGGDLFADVIRTEEKGSDVNLAVHLLNDAWHDRYDAALVVSNDSDLAEALRLVKEERNKEVILLTPPKFRRRRSQVLKNAATRCMTIKNKHLAASQLPDLIPQTSLYKPPSW